jgi:signal peptidase I
MEPTLMGPPKGEYNPSLMGQHPMISYRATGGDHILVNKFVYRLNPPERGDIVVFDAPPQALQGRPKSDFVKRLIGLPGDLIEVRREVGVFVNGQLLQEPASTPRPHYDWPVGADGLPTGRPYLVPPGCYFVLGDNRDESYDSHAWTINGEPRPELTKGRVVGKALLIYWPLHRIGLVGDHAQVHLGQTTTVAGSDHAARARVVGRPGVRPVTRHSEARRRVASAS